MGRWIVQRMVFRRLLSLAVNMKLLSPQAPFTDMVTLSSHKADFGSGWGVVLVS